MKRYSVYIPEVVRDQVTEQVIVIARDSINNALRWQERVIDAMERLADVHSYAVDEEGSERLGVEVRKLVFEGTYLIHFRVDDTKGAISVIIFGTEHAGRVEASHSWAAW